MSKKLIYKRPKHGYSTKKEREWNCVSGISEYEIFYNGKNIGFVWKEFRYNTVQWNYEIPSLKIKDYEETLSSVKYLLNYKLKNIPLLKKRELGYA